jgi:hypothetical protein
VKIPIFINNLREMGTSTKHHILHKGGLTVGLSEKF